MFKSARSIAITVLLLGALAASGCGSSSGSSSSQSSASAAGGSASTNLHVVKVALVPIEDAMAVMLGDKKGIFAKHGVRIQYVTPAPTGAGQVPQLLNGEANVGLGALTSVMTASASNLPIQAVGAFSQDFNRGGQTDFVLVLGKHTGVKSYKDLQGKTVAVNSLKGSWEVSVRGAVAHDGGDPSKINVVAIPFADQAAALAQGRVAGVMTLQPFASSLTQQGYPSLGDPQALATGDPNNVANVMFMAKSFIAKDPEAAKGFVAGLQEASQYANAHPAEIKALTVTQTKVPASLVDKAPVPDFTAALTPANVRAWNTLLVKYGILKSPVPVTQVRWSGAQTS